ncbi:S1 family peptidase [Methanosarcina sp. T3]|uniref:S1 family peptidase n=1 Tax=Methanosarcina sp. T3 TaxID=3439062 RepID=UPI003F858A0E
MSGLPESSIVKVLYGEEGEAAGAGFLVGNKWVVTCRHVVESILPSDKISLLPSDTIYLTFYLDEVKQSLKSRVFFLSNEKEPDIAILKLEDEVPRCASAGKLAIRYDFWNLELKVCGFPSGDKAEWVSVVGRGRSNLNHVQIDISQDSAYKIVGGFSGTPVFDTKLNNIVGIVVYKEKAAGILSGGFIPVVKIINLCKKHLIEHKVFGKNIPNPFSTQLINALEWGISCLSTRENRKRLNCIILELNPSNEKVGQVFIKEIKDAFESLTDAYLTTNRETKNNRLNFAEERFLKNSHVDTNLKFRKHSSLDLMALSHYGLSIICYFRNDDTISLKHILQAYELSPQFSRTKLLPEFYDSCLSAEVVKRVNLWENKELNSLNKKSYAGKEALMKTMAVLSFATGTALIFTGKKNPAMLLMQTSDKMWNTDSASLRAEAISALKAKKPDKMEEFCKVLANELLTELEQSSIGEYFLV